MDLLGQTFCRKRLLRCLCNVNHKSTKRENGRKETKKKLQKDSKGTQEYHKETQNNYRDTQKDH